MNKMIYAVTRLDISGKGLVIEIYRKMYDFVQITP
jgi:hypothetical protein